MSAYSKKASLPPTELGTNRCFEIGYFGHGDIVISTWQGSLKHEPRYRDRISTRFGLAHGNDSMIVAAFAGYLRRLGKTKDEAGQIMTEAGKGILLANSRSAPYHHPPSSGFLGVIANGKPITRYDEIDTGLKCLLPPTPAQPGTIDSTGGTAMYTWHDLNSQNTYLMLGQRIGTQLENGDRTTVLGETATFCEKDIPTMANLACQLALGEYQEEIRVFLRNEYIHS
ncbi:hypothetical protein EOL96_01980 [Candidatus Saccharibacteria bacterium]|nr:hypothetical protein [Candidatus Saccharibacteria bacterium]